jgi:hypothetical protein
LFVLVLAGAVIIGLLLGLLGGGGAILTVPLLVHVQGVDPRTAIATALLVVLATSLTSLYPHARAGNVRWRIGLAFGVGGAVGAHAGGRLAGLLSPALLLASFAVVMGVTAVALLRCRTCDGEEIAAARPSARAAAKLAGTGGLVGLVVGTVGVGGGFLIVPVLNMVAGLSTRSAIGTSVLIIGLNSLAGLSGHLQHAKLELTLGLPLAALAILGSQVGARLSPRVPQRALRRGFSVLVLALAVLQLGSLVR